jgi:hypothetical protein
MSRSFIAIFALHFFLSVSAFAFGDVVPAPVVKAHAALAMQAPQAGADTDAMSDLGKIESTLSHALADEVPDLPDSLPRALQAQKPPVDGGPTIVFRQRSALAPALDGLLRPPQQATFTA